MHEYAACWKVITNTNTIHFTKGGYLSAAIPAIGTEQTENGQCAIGAKISTLLRDITLCGTTATYLLLVSFGY